MHTCTGVTLCGYQKKNGTPVYSPVYLHLCVAVYTDMPRTQKAAPGIVLRYPRVYASTWLVEGYKRGISSNSEAQSYMERNNRRF